eukprot:TRINITY_DN24193_c0_g2_i1.p1 TRINITY_DN24193_c0_g2~~TRINITY_DN24193_c0_g2_i1.p1  ORF type:complete len:588 (-),score=118.57 TRINITY_DN24193_c0_g2_i1:139-1845(-)
MAPAPARRGQSSRWRWSRPAPGELESLMENWKRAGCGSVDEVELHGTPPDLADAREPLVIRGAASNMPALAWCQGAAEEFLRRFGHLNVRPKPCSLLHHFGSQGPRRAPLSLTEYLNQQETRSSDDLDKVNESAEAAGVGCVVFENDYGELQRSLLESGAMRSDSEALRSIHAVPIFSAAYAGTGVGFHAHAEAWLAQLAGTKLWWLCPPQPHGGAAHLRHDRPPWEYLRPECWPCGDVRFCAVQPGDALFIPRGWWHATWNRDDLTIGVGWEGSAASRSWSRSLHAIADCDPEAVRSFGDVADDAAAADQSTMWPEAFALAARIGNCELLELLLSGRRGKAALSEQVQRAAKLAAGNGHLAALQLLLLAATAEGEREARLEAMHASAMAGYADIVKWLLDTRKAAPSLEEETAALQRAAHNGHVDVVLALLQARVDPCAATAASRGRTPVAIAAAAGHAAVLGALLTGDEEASCPSSTTLEPLLRPDVEGNTPLHLASKRGAADCARHLLRARADAAARDASGQTPLEAAADALAPWAPGEAGTLSAAPEVKELWYQELQNLFAEAN